MHGGEKVRRITVLNGLKIRKDPILNYLAYNIQTNITR